MNVKKIGLILGSYMIINCLSLSAAATIQSPGIEIQQQKSAGLNVSDAVKTKEYVSQNGGYTIQLPDNWETKQGYMGLDVYGLAPIQGPEDQFRENFNLIFSDLDKEISLDDYYNTNVMYLQKLLTDYKLQDQGVAKIDGKDAKWIRYSHRMGEVNAVMLQYLFLNGNREYVITFAASPEDFSKYEDIFKQIASSFKFDK